MTRISSGGIILPTDPAEENPNAFLNFSGKQVRIAWDHDAYLSDMYEMWLQAVQQDKSEHSTGKPYTNKTVFEEWLKDCLTALATRRVELKSQRDGGDLDNNTYQNARMTADLAEEAIKKFLEKSDNKRLIGV